MNATQSPPPPPPPAFKLTASHKALTGLVAFLVVAKLVEMFVHIPFHGTAQQGVFSWKMTAFFVALALLGSGFAHIVGFPGMWEEKVIIRRKIWLPLAVGIVFGAALLAVDRSSGFAHLYAAAAGQPSLTLPFPYSVLFQTYAAACAAILYNLFALAFTVWFVGTLLLARRWPSQTFWVFALLMSFWEPYVMASQGHWALFHSGPLSAGIVGVLALVYGMDLAAMLFIRRSGFTAALVLRLSVVALWHIIGVL